MSTPSNPSSLMIYKIVRDYEKNERTAHTLEELYSFAKSALEFANTISDKNFWIADTPQTKEDLNRLCDLTTSLCELNTEKYKNGGQIFAKAKIGQMPYTWLKGAINEMNKNAFNTANQETIK